MIRVPPPSGFVDSSDSRPQRNAQSGPTIQRIARRRGRLPFSLIIALLAGAISATHVAADDQIEVQTGSIAVVDKIDLSDQQGYPLLKFTLIAGDVVGNVQNFTLLNFFIPEIFSAGVESYSFSFFPSGDPMEIGTPGRNVEIQRDLVTGHFVSETMNVRLAFEAEQIPVSTADMTMFLTTDRTGSVAGHAPLPIFCDLNPLNFVPVGSPLVGNDLVLVAVGCVDVPHSANLASFAALLEINGELIEDIQVSVCSDGQDNDGDGVADHPLDPGCLSASDNSEKQSGIACDDGIDNDGDGDIDFLEDADCDSPGDRTEQAVCGNGILEGSETCDDGNRSSGDCCSSSCRLEPAGQSCDSGTACRLGTTCDSSGSCGGGSVVNCDDGLFCNGVETCNASLGCRNGVPPNTNDGIACTTGVCNESRNRIDQFPDHAYCDNGDFCDGTESCSVTLGCQDGTAPDVNDGVGCTLDFCDSNKQEILHVPNDLRCNNHLWCDGSESCDAELDCQTGPAPPVDDGVSCTVDSCDELNDTVIHAPDDSVCNNGLFCDGLETCDAVLDCQTGPAPADDGVGCTIDTCVEATQQTANVPDDTACDNGLFCDGSETCDAVQDCQAGAAPTVDDGVSCTADSCDEDNDVVVHAPDATVCDNGTFCDGAEICDVTLDCQAGIAPEPDDGVSCTVDFCDEEADQVVNSADDAACNNGLFCDGLETCDALLDCQSGTPPVADDGVVCTIESCDEVSDSILHTPDDSVCDNATFCDGAEVCDAMLGCQDGPAPIVDDGVGCTLDSCDEAADTIVNAPDDGACDNGAFCDGSESCDVTLGCQGGTPPVADDGVACTNDSCDETTDSIVNTPDDGACDNGAFCDGSETCDVTLGCQGGTPPVADDGVACTNDSCDETTDSIVNTPDDGACDNGLFCDGSETCDVTLGCQGGTPPVADDGVACTNDSCDETTDSIVNAPDDGACDNGAFCDGSETCDVTLGCQGGTPPVADDGVACTNDSCDETTDSIVNTPDDGACNNGAFCDGSETCDVTLGCQGGTPPVADDGVACTNDSCDETTDSIVNTPDHGACDNGAFCDGAETCDAQVGCLGGTPVVTDDGVACTEDSCDEAADEIIHAPDDLQCQGNDPCVSYLCAETGCSEVPIPNCLPDLIVSQVDGPITAVPGSTVTSMANVMNAGIAPATPLVSFFLSPNSEIDPNADALVGQCELGALDGGNGDSCADLSLLVPEDIVPDGNRVPFFWGACADVAMSVDETNEDNNCLAGNSVMVPEPASWHLYLAALTVLAGLSGRYRRSAHAPHPRRRLEIS